MKLWFRLSGKPYSGNEPFFFEPEKFEWARLIMDNRAVISGEMKLMINDGQNAILKPYFEDAIQFPPKNWKTESFFFWTKANRIMIGMFPQTYHILKQVPGLVSASVNLLEPGTTILPHYGDTNAIYRCHFGLKVPATLPECGFRVETETRPWEEGKFLIFLDAYTHEAFNNSGQKRYILLLDVLRPEFRNRKYYVCTKILGTMSLYQLAGKIPGMRKRFESWPALLKNAWLLPAQVYWALYLFLQRNIFSTHLR